MIRYITPLGVGVFDLAHNSVLFNPLGENSYFTLTWSIY